jgi:hypothetical protein
MLPGDVFDVLAKCAAFDRRTFGESDVRAWCDVIGDLDRQVALNAVSTWYRTHREMIMPSDIRRIVNTRRRHENPLLQRIRHLEQLCDQPDGEVWQEELEQVLELYRLGAGLPARRQISGL